MAYTANGAIALTPQRAILDASQATVNLTLGAPGGDLVGKIIAAVAVDLTNNAQITFPSAQNTSEVHAFTEVGQSVWFYGATESVWTKLSDVPAGIPLGTYGDGNDGDETIAANTEVTTNFYWENLTLNASVALTAKNLILFVKDTLTLNANSFIAANGAVGDAAGAGGLGPPARWFGEDQEIGSGGSGGNNAGAGTAGAGSDKGLGGSGGAGGAGDGAGGSGGTITAPTYFPRFLEAILHGQDRNGLGYDGGAGGGGGGGGDTTQAPGGGAGGGIVVVVARHMVINTSGSSSFRSLGGSGGDAKFARCGGGGGGGGGFVCLVYQTAKDHNGNYLSDSDLENLIDVSGGSGGAGFSPGVAGSAGSTGSRIVFRHG